MGKKKSQYTLFLNENTPLQHKVMEQNDPSFLNSIQLLKAETLSPDWALSPRRNENLRAAMDILNVFCHNRRYARGLVAMAQQLLCHLAANKVSGAGVIDLLKEVMAHIVTIVEQDEPDTVFERSTCGHCLRQLNRLGLSLQLKPTVVNKFAQANDSLKEDITRLQSLAVHFNTLSATQQTKALLTIQSLIAETKALQKIMTAPG